MNGPRPRFRPVFFGLFTHLLMHDIHHRSQINQYLRILGIKPSAI